MSSQLPPDPYFNNINFNPSFFIDNDPFLTQAMANFLYLKITGGNITGNLGIGTTPLAKLHIVEPTGTPALANNGTIIIDHNNAGGASSILFRSAIARGSDYGYIQYQDATTVGGEGEAAKLIIGTQNDNTDDIILLPSGNVGIKATNPLSLLTLNPVPTVISGGFDFSLCPMTITNPNATGTSAINDPRPVLHLCRNGTFSQAFGARATFNLCRYENNGDKSRTRLDLVLSHDSFNDVNVMTIRSDGRVGVGTTDPQNNIDVFGTDCKVAVRAANENQSAILYLGTGHNGSNVYKSAIIAEGFSSFSKSRLHFCTNNADNNVDSATIGNARMTIVSNGNIGMGTTDPKSLLTLNAVPTVISGGFDFSLCPMTITNPNATGTAAINDPRPVLHLCRNGTFGESFGARATFNLCRFENNEVNSRTRLDLVLSHGAFNDVNVMTIRSDGRVGIGTTNPGSAFQIRAPNNAILRIETNTDAASQTSGIEFGTPDITSANSAKITSTRLADNKNDIQFYTSNGAASTSKLYINPADVAITTSCNTIGANYFTDGQYIVGETRINTSGQTKTGYFLSLAKFFNSVVLISVSHVDPNYTYWHGHFGTNNSNGVIYINAISQSNMTFEAFVEQTSNASFMFMKPSISFNYSTQIRVKHYG